MKKWKSYLFLFLLLIVLILFETNLSTSLFGSTTDWLNQHTVFPEYFRNLFYKTHQLFPNFAFHLGAGQNIFYFAYYGLFNPWILLSYFLPMIKMSTYLECINLLSILASAFLLYHWLEKKKLDPHAIVLATGLFMCAVPIIYQAHRHFMFVSYMPFLIMGLIGIDRYFQKNQKSLIALSIFLMIMTSYYYSIGGLLAMAIYYIAEDLQRRKHFKWKEFIKSGLKFLVPYLLGILLAGLLLLPVGYVILTGRSEDVNSFSLLDLILPKFNLKNWLYDGYGLGLTAITVIALCFCGWGKNRGHRFLAIACALLGIIPLFLYLLNGTLYIRGKVLIPLLPLFFLLLAIFLDHLIKDKGTISFHKQVVTFLIIGLLASLMTTSKLLVGGFWLDVLVTFGILGIFLKKRKIVVLYGLLILAGIVNIAVNQTETYVDRESYQNIHREEITRSFEWIQAQDSDLYRMKQLLYNLPVINLSYNQNFYLTSLYSSTQNPFYQEFYRTYLANSIANRNNLMISSTSNYFFDLFMGVKYVMGNNLSMFGYEPVKGSTNLYQNTYALPMFYVTNELYQENAFDHLDPVEQIEPLLKGVVVDGKGATTFTPTIEKVKLDYELVGDPLDITKVGDHKMVEVSESTKVQAQLQNMEKDKILLLKFDIQNSVSCEEGDRTITINGHVNKLTCDDWLYKNDNDTFYYVLAEKDLKSLQIELSKGRYEIANEEAYLLDVHVLDSIKDTHDPMKVDVKDTVGDQIAGTINVSQDGYFVTSIPYDTGFKIELDGEEIAYERVNKAFIGFPITKGYHEVTIHYQAPFAKAGQFVSAFGLVGLLLLVYFDLKDEKKSKKQVDFRENVI